MRLAFFGTLLFVIGCAGSDGSNDDSGIDEPPVPQLGLWEVVAFDFNSTCRGPGSSRVHHIFVGRPDGLNHLSWGQNWDFVGIRCPIGPEGSFLCEAQQVVIRDDAQRTERSGTITLSGRATLVGGDFFAQLEVLTRCEAWDGGECEFEECTYVEDVELEWVSADGL